MLLIALIRVPLCVAEPDPSTLLVRVEKMLQAENVSEALALLRPLVARVPDHARANFMLGMAALGAVRLPQPPVGGEWTPAQRTALQDEAVAAFRRVLLQHPTLPRPRLELARALFERGRCNQPVEALLRHLLGDDCEAAERHLRRTLATQHPPAVVSNINRYLNVIQARKRIRGHFQLFAAPDSNVNAATEADTVRVFGLPFNLSEDARETSGLGLILSAAAEYQHPLPFTPLGATRSRWRVGGGLYRRDYESDHFDDMTLSVNTGPRLRFRRGEFSFLYKANQRWLGDHRFSQDRGVSLEGGRRFGNRVWLSGGVEVTRRKHRDVALQDGIRRNVNFSAFFTLNPAVSLGTHLGWGRAQTDSVFERHDRYSLGVSANVDLPPLFGLVGFGLAFSQDWYEANYERAKQGLNPRPREDRLLVSRIAVHNRAYDVWGFTPTLSWVREIRDSNIVLYEYQRNRFELGLRRLF